MTHYKDIKNNTIKWYMTDDNKKMLLLDPIKRVDIVNIMLDAVEIINDGGQEAAAIRANLNHMDYDILDTHVNTVYDSESSKYIMSSKQTLLWAIIPIESDGLGEDLNDRQLVKLNRALTKIGFKKIVYKFGQQLSPKQMKIRMDELRFLRANKLKIQDTNRFNSMFNK